MTQFALAARSQIRNVLLCTLATLTLAACGSESDSGSAAVGAASGSDSSSALVSTSVGMIDRSQGAETTASTSAPATSVPATSTVATNDKATTPIQTINGVATLDWMPPTENSDGTTLTNLAGYTVYYGSSPSDLTQSVKVTNPGLTAYTVTGLTSGTWYFAVTSYSADGVESSRTGTVSTTI